MHVSIYLRGVSLQNVVVNVAEVGTSHSKLDDWNIHNSSCRLFTAELYQEIGLVEAIVCGFPTNFIKLLHCKNI